jgi:hypothetical protein
MIPLVRKEPIIFNKGHAQLNLPFLPFYPFFWATEKYGDNRLNAEATTSTSAHLGISLFFCTKNAHKKQDNNKNPTSELLRKTKGSPLDGRDGCPRRRQSRIRIIKIRRTGTRTNINKCSMPNPFALFLLLLLPSPSITSRRSLRFHY